MPVSNNEPRDQIDRDFIATQTVVQLLEMTVEQSNDTIFICNGGDFAFLTPYCGGDTT